jgi:hypothetical protein
MVIGSDVVGGVAEEGQMIPHTRLQVVRDLDLIDRFVTSYNQRFLGLINELNATGTRVCVAEALRLCVEAAHMMLDNQQRLARALRELSDAPASEQFRQAA